jgi:hypothetical protein
MIASLFAGQPGVGGFAFVSQMMWRDWQFGRQLLPAVLPGLMGLIPLLAGGWRIDPFLGGFTSMHFFPHLFGAVLLIVCTLLPYGSDYKGAWIFLLAPEQAIRRFACGVYALLWTELIVIPHVIVFPLLAWSWGIQHAVLFVGFSVTVASLYLALDLRMIEGAPFSRQIDTSRRPVLLGVMVMGGFAIAIAVALQHFAVFHSPLAVVVITAAIGIAAYFLTLSSLSAFETSIQYNLALQSAGSESFYKEVNV